MYFYIVVIRAGMTAYPSFCKHYIKFIQSLVIISFNGHHTPVHAQTYHRLFKLTLPIEQ